MVPYEIFFTLLLYYYEMRILFSRRSAAKRKKTNVPDGVRTSHDYCYSCSCTLVAVAMNASSTMHPVLALHSKYSAPNSSATFRPVLVSTMPARSCCCPSCPTSSRKSTFKTQKGGRDVIYRMFFARPTSCCVPSLLLLHPSVD